MGYRSGLLALPFESRMSHGFALYSIVSVAPFLSSVLHELYSKAHKPLYWALRRHLLHRIARCIIKSGLIFLLVVCNAIGS